MRAMVIAIAIAVSAAGCARPNVAARPPDAPLGAPDGVDRAFSVFDSGGAQLFEQCWRPTEGDVHGVLVIVHGIKDHGSRYHDTAVDLVGAGFAVCAFDHRGHGRSSGPRFAIHSFARVMDDIDRYLGMVRERFAGAPIALFGHSMGGAMVSLYAVDRQPDLAGLIVSSSALRPQIHPFEIAGLRAAAAVFPNAALLDVPDADFSPDPAVVQGMTDDPLIHHGKGTGKMGVELIGAVERVWREAASIRLPVLILHGVADQATNPRGSVELLERVGSADKTLELYDGAGHDLAHDPKRAEVIADLIGWLGQRMR